MIPFKMSSVVRTQGQAPVKTNKEEEWSSSIQHATHLWCYQWKQLIITVSGWNAPLQKQIEKVTHDFGLRPFNVNPLIPLNNGFPTVLQKIWLGTLKAKVFHVHHMSFHSSLTSTFLKCRLAVLGREIGYFWVMSILLKRFWANCCHEKCNGSWICLLVWTFEAPTESWLHLRQSSCTYGDALGKKNHTNTCEVFDPVDVEETSQAHEGRSFHDSLRLLSPPQMPMF